MLTTDDEPVRWALSVFGLERKDATPTRIQNEMLSFELDHQDQDVQTKSRHFKVARDILLSVYAYCVQLPTSSKFHTKEFSSEDDTPFQRLLLFILRRLFECGLRRLGDSCCRKLEIGGVPTLAWKKTCTVREFVLLETRKETNTSQWKNLTHSRENLDSVCKTLVEFQHTEFPDLVIDESLICFLNGTFCISQGRFWEHGHGDKIDAETEEVHQDEKKGMSHPLTTSCTCSFVNTLYRENVCSEFLSDVSCVLVDMGIEQPYHSWFFALFGRLLFKVNALEKWHVMPFCKTSTHCDSLIFNMFVTILETITGPKTVCKLTSHLSLETITSFRLCAMLLRDTCLMDQGDWHLATSGEVLHMGSSNKGKMQSVHSSEWKTPFIGIGSGIPYKNDAGTVDRRVVLFDMSNATETKVKRFATLILENVDLWLSHTINSYLDMVSQHADHNIWEILPPCFATTREMLKEITNPLLSCIKSNLFKQDPSFFMPLSDFKDMYQDFRRQRGLPPQRWVREHWQATFQDEKLSIERRQREQNSTKSTTDCVVGISPVFNIRDSDLVVTVEFVETLNREAEAAHKKHAAARDLLMIEQELLHLKVKRSAAVEQFRSLDA